MLKAVLGP
jgi:serine/threonine-protein kinase ATR